MPIIAGIDYSMSCPALYLIDSEKEFTFQNGKSFFLTDIKKHQKSIKNITGIPQIDFKTSEERYDIISNTFLKIIQEYDVKSVGIEDYSLGSTGQVFNIAENTGLLKHKLYKQNINFSLYAPTTIKKFATGKGNAKKEDMFYHFLKKEIDIRPDLEYSKSTIGSPLGDIVDSFFICQYHLFNLKK